MYACINVCKKAVMVSCVQQQIAILVLAGKITFLFVCIALNVKMLGLML